MLTRKIGCSLFEDEGLKLSEIDTAVFLDMNDKILQGVQDEVMLPAQSAGHPGN